MRSSVAPKIDFIFDFIIEIFFNEEEETRDKAIRIFDRSME